MEKRGGMFTWVKKLGKGRTIEKLNLQETKPVVHAKSTHNLEEIRQAYKDGALIETQEEEITRLEAENSEKMGPEKDLSSGEEGDVARNERRIAQLEKENEQIKHKNRKA